MKILLLGAGIQGKAALFDLSKRRWVSAMVVADLFPDNVRSLAFVDQTRTTLETIDVNDQQALVALMNQGFDVVLDFLPPKFVTSVTEAAIEAGVNLVNTNYASPIRPLQDRALNKGLTIMPECGLDPGIDLVLYGYGRGQFDELYVLNSYCGGIPEKTACTNPLNYKISWNWDAALRSQNRDATLIKDRQLIKISGKDQHDNPFVHDIDFPGLGRLEAIPNGDAAYFVDLLDLASSIEETGRYSLRWPGWSAFWRPLKKFGCFSESPVDGRACAVSPHDFFVKWLEPQLQYEATEKDLAVMQNVFIGTKHGKKKKLTINVLIERDLATGLMGMSLGVSYPACIVAEMIAKGEIDKKGILSPVRDVPADLFLARLKSRGINIEQHTDTQH